MNNLGMNVVRMWAFCDGDDANNIFILQSAPYTWNEKSFQKLDFVIHTAREYNIKTILTFVNNWNDLGGMNQYLKWYARSINKTELLNKIENRKYSSSGAAKYYDDYIADALSHDDFYKSDTIKTWYKAYINNLLNRTNTFSNIKYKNDETIMAF